MSAQEIGILPLAVAAHQSGYNTPERIVAALEEIIKENAEYLNRPYRRDKPLAFNATTVRRNQIMAAAIVLLDSGASIRVPDNALSTAYHHAKPLLDEITPQLDILPAYFGSLVALAKSSTSLLDRTNVDAAGAGVLHIFQVLQEVATTYHDLVGELVSDTSPLESEAQLE